MEEGLARQLAYGRELHPPIGKERTVSALSDAEVSSPPLAFRETALRTKEASS